MEIEEKKKIMRYRGSRQKPIVILSVRNKSWRIRTFISSNNKSQVYKFKNKNKNHYYIYEYMYILILHFYKKL